MKKYELKRILKPLVKECVRDVLLEEGILSSVVSEVVKGLHTNVITENNQRKTPETKPSKEHMELLAEKQELLKQQKKKMLDAIGFGTDIFEGTEPVSNVGNPEAPPQAGALSGVEPNDAGVDLSGIMAAANRNWRDMI